MIVAYVLVGLAWIYLLATCLSRIRAVGSSNPPIVRIYKVLVFGAACALVATVNEEVQLVLVAGTVPFQASLVAPQIAQFCANVFALVAALVFAVRGSLPVIEEGQRRLQARGNELESLVEQRTAELQATVEQLEADTREREQIQLELRAEHAMLDGIMKASVGAICVVNAHGDIVFANSAAQSVLGVTCDEATQRKYNSPEWRHTDLYGRPLP